MKPQPQTDAHLNIKPCPKCGNGYLRIRTNRDTGEQFLGCTNYPNCQHHEPLPEDRAQAARHAPRLPGM